MDREWFRCATVYHILIDRFAGFAPGRENEPVFCGGNLRGVIDKLPYLIDLGVDAVYLSPFYACTDYHGYHITDCYRVDPRFGTEADFTELARRVHEAGLRLIIDFVPNHLSREHPFFQAAAASPKSEYRPWFFLARDGSYRTFLDVDALPKLNLDFPPAREHVIGAAKHWLGLGADGLRLDHAVGPSRAFLLELRRAVAERKPEAVIVAEAWLPHPPFRFIKTIGLPRKYLRYFTRALSQERLERECAAFFDGALDFTARGLFRRQIAHRDERHLGPAEAAEALAIALRRHFRRFPSSFFLPAFLDNHDTNRFYFECGHDRARLVQALTLLFRLPQPVFLYYGTETGLSQENPILIGTPHADLQARRLMNWDTPDRELLAQVKELIRLRRQGAGEPFPG